MFNPSMRTCAVPLCGAADLDASRVGASEGVQSELLLRVPLVLAEGALPAD